MAAAPATSQRSRQLVFATIGTLALLIVGLGAYFLGRGAGALKPPQFRRVTYRRGTVNGARFGPDGQAIVYSAAWEGAPPDVFSTRAGSAESRSLGLPPSTEILAISASGQSAILLNSRSISAFERAGMLAEMPLEGGAPREILNDVTAADWAPDGKQVAVVRYQPGKQTLEYPIGKTLYETQGWIGNPRFSPDGKRIAFVDHVLRNDDVGAVAIVDLTGKKNVLTESWPSIRGMAWNATRDEIWFTASALGSSRGLYAVSLSGKPISIAQVPGTLTLFDIAKDGRALVAEANERVEMAARSKDWAGERSLSWLDWTLLADLSADGKTLLFTEGGEGGGPDYSVYTRKIDGSAAVRLGEGQAFELSPDGRWCIVVHTHDAGALFLVPTGAGEMRQLTSGNLTAYGPTWLPDGSGVLYNARDAGHKARIYLKKLDGSAESALTAEGFTVARHGVSPDGGSFLAIRGTEKKLVLVPIKGGDGQAVPGVDASEIPIGWASDGHSIYVYQYGTPTSPSRISEVDIKSGKRELLKEWMPDDRAGYAGFDIGQITPDKKTIAYSYTRVLGDLYLVDSVR